MTECGGKAVKKLQNIAIEFKKEGERRLLSLVTQAEISERISRFRERTIADREPRALALRTRQQLPRVATLARLLLVHRW